MRYCLSKFCNKVLILFADYRKGLLKSVIILVELKTLTVIGVTIYCCWHQLEKHLRQKQKYGNN